MQPNNTPKNHMKYTSPFITGACVAALAFGGASLAFAKKPAAAPTPAASAAPAASAPAAKAPRAIPFRGNATAIDKSAKSFTVAGKTKSRVFKVTDKTAVTKMGNAATFADLTEGEAVTGSYWKQADGTLEAKSLKIGGKSDAEKAADDAAKMKKEAKKAAKENAAAPTPAAPPATPTAAPKKK